MPVLHIQVNIFYVLCTFHNGSEVVMKSRFFGILSLCFLLGCGGAQKKTASTPIPAPVIVSTQEQIKAKSPQRMGETVENSSWKITLPEKWQYKLDEQGPNQDFKKELIARSVEVFGGHHLVISLISTKFDKDPMTFINGTLNAALGSNDVHIFDTTLIKVGRYPGALIVALRNLPEIGPIGSVDLLTAGNGNAYALSCGGTADELDSFSNMCLDVIQSFELKQVPYELKQQL